MTPTTTLLIARDPPAADLREYVIILNASVNKGIHLRWLSGFLQLLAGEKVDPQPDWEGFIKGYSAVLLLETVALLERNEADVEILEENRTSRLDAVTQYVSL